jgi:membrane protease YdiL (CAAX protease family)
MRREARPEPVEDRATGRVVFAEPLSSLRPGPPLGRAAAVGRVAAFTGLSLVALFIVPALVYPFVRLANAAAGTRLIGYSAIGCAAMLIATVVTLRLFREPWREGTRLGSDALGAWPVFGGFAAGWFAIAMPCGVLIWLGVLHIVPAEPGSWERGAVLALGILVPAALTEELALRGYAFNVLLRAWGPVVAVALTSVAFGLLHLFNPGVAPQSVVMVTLAGVFLALVRLAFNSLWAAWLAHLAYNFVQAAVFHTTVSGLAIPQPNYRTVSVGPDWLTGGAWGPEAGAAAAGGMFVVSFLLAVHAGWVRNPLRAR